MAPGQFPIFLSEMELTQVDNMLVMQCGDTVKNCLEDLFSGTRWWFFLDQIKKAFFQVIVNEDALLRDAVTGQSNILARADLRANGLFEMSEHLLGNIFQYMLALVRPVDRQSHSIGIASISYVASQTRPNFGRS